jgi:hypothetical protein
MATEETLSATVNARVPQSEYERIVEETRRRRRAGAWVSVADIIREALHEYFATRESPAEINRNE